VKSRVKVPAFATGAENINTAAVIDVASATLEIKLGTRMYSPKSFATQARTTGYLS